MTIDDQSFQTANFKWSEKSFNIPSIKQVNDENLGRYYTFIAESIITKIILYSVTTVLGDDPDHKLVLQNWRKRIGEEKANAISKFSTNRGTSIHKLLEQYIKNIPISDNDISPNIKNMFYSAIPILKDNIDLVYCLEKKLFSSKLGLAGTADGIVNWNGIPSLLDFKTSGKIKRKEYIENYFLQTCAYSIMWNELTKSNIDQLVIFIMLPDEAFPQIFIESANKYKPLLLKRIYEFYSRRNLKLPEVFL